MIYAIVILVGVVLLFIRLWLDEMAEVRYWKMKEKSVHKLWIDAVDRLKGE